MKQKDVNEFNWHISGKDKVIKVDDNLYIRLRKTSNTYIIPKTVNRKAQVITPGRHPCPVTLKSKSEANSYLEADTSSVTVVTMKIL
jgi:hypothetical protein